ncbi:MAG: hypothetical protein HY597_02980 [Candidatus Omnitrophica bacterium]|nr:hypothetical protein [Candidatus Omnitrophota bacterium]
MRHLLPLLRAALQGSLLVILAQSTGRWFYVFQPDRSRKLMEQLETIRAAQAVGPEA